MTVKTKSIKMKADCSLMIISMINNTYSLGNSCRVMSPKVVWIVAHSATLLYEVSCDAATSSSFDGFSLNTSLSFSSSLQQTPMIKCLIVSITHTRSLLTKFMPSFIPFHIIGTSFGKQIESILFECGADQRWVSF